MSEPFPMQQTIFHVHQNLVTGEYAWYHGEVRESEWFKTQAQAENWDSLRDCRSHKEGHVMALRDFLSKHP